MSRNLYDTDKVVTNVWLSLLKDFRSRWGETFCENQESALKSGVPSFRNSTWSTLGIVDPFYYKARYQMESLLKKYRFHKDLYSDEELEERTNSSYLDFQQVIAAHVIQGEASFRLLKKARSIITKILGDVTDEEIHENVRFGRRSSVGCSLRSAYLDNKLTVKEYFTSSTEGGKWFCNTYLPEDSILRRVVDRSIVARWCDGDQLLHHNHLTLTNVPKSWKIRRSITPLTLVDLFRTYGVGKVVQARLKDAGLDISRLQSRHQRLARRYSTTLKGATADLSRASDSISKVLLLRLLPRKWYNAIRSSLSHQVLVDGKLCYTESILPMGNGFTFPLETLIFYSLIKAAGELTNTKGLYSVYGDDLIYPTRLHKYIAWVLPKLCISLNLEKTYASFPFRESCGGDFYRGIDVRPAIITGERQLLTASKYSAFLYTLYNSITRRWSTEDVAATLQVLEEEILRVQGTIFRVPMSYPDTSGIKTPEDHWNKDPRFENIEHGFKDGSTFIRFKWLAEVPKYRYVICQDAYYWDKIRNRLQRDDDVVTYSAFSQEKSQIKRRIEKMILPASSIVWKKIPKGDQSRFGRKKKEYAAFTVTREDPSLVCQTSSVSCWA